MTAKSIIAYLQLHSAARHLGHYTGPLLLLLASTFDPLLPALHSPVRCPRMEFLHRAVPHRIRRLVSRAKGKETGTGTEDSYRLRRMESHVSMAATKRRRIYLNLTPESVDHDNAASSHDSLPHYPTNKIRTSIDWRDEHQEGEKEENVEAERIKRGRQTG
ncbi:hypothetical protein BGW38_002768 [Lunasporangiospora selenospora]|uniref:Uncharacterized protein n=1 Tax=Lunasporangiospora selenospora TaxID=979761 RepID=A0A9P6G5N5_9FUNG|nr:hypothetical protein BGW38_002768 [Lunasporangiospora selenospora]